MIPIVEQDFMFCKICEELGGFLCDLPDPHLHELLYHVREHRLQDGK